MFFRAATRKGTNVDVRLLRISLEKWIFGYGGRKLMLGTVRGAELQQRTVIAATLSFRE